MKVAIIGAGAIGGLVAGYFADKGEQVLLVTPSEYVAPISQNGLTIEGVRGRVFVRLPVKNQLDEKADLVILATKTQDLEEAISRNLTYLKGVTLLTVQNGVRAEDLIAERLGTDNLCASIVMFGATYRTPGNIVHNFEGDWILGQINSGAQETLKETGMVTSKIFPSPLSNDITGMKWLKLFINANNCLPALLGKSMQETFENIQVCKISLRIWQEGLDIVKKAGITLSSLPTFPVERLAKLASMPLDQSAKIFSSIMLNLSKEPLYGSILQSIQRKRPSEIDYINGEFVRLADLIHQRAPLNEKLVYAVHEVEKSGKFLSEDALLNQTREWIN
jgi:2-dehydropantoate 2-reductase